MSLVGFLDAVYLTIVHYRGGELRCGPLKGCEVVTSSEYAVIGGIPLAALGVLYYVSIFLLTVGYFDTKYHRILTAIVTLTIIGFLASLCLVYLQAFVIRALCFYCLISALTSTGLFVFTVAFKVR